MDWAIHESRFTQLCILSYVFFLQILLYTSVIIYMYGVYNIDSEIKSINQSIIVIQAIAHRDKTRHIPRSEVSYSQLFEAKFRPAPRFNIIFTRPDWIG